jgi:hypothetical protein
LPCRLIAYLVDYQVDVSHSDANYLKLNILASRRKNILKIFAKILQKNLEDKIFCVPLQPV